MSGWDIHARTTIDFPGSRERRGSWRCNVIESASGAGEAIQSI
jgi:hypothetical protein